MNARRVLLGVAGLIALQVFATQTKVADALGVVPGFLNRLSSPDVALIKDRATLAAQKQAASTAQQQSGAGGSAASQHLSDLNSMAGARQNLVPRHL